MPHPPYIRALAYVPLHVLPDVAGIKEQLTVRVRRRIVVGANGQPTFGLEDEFADMPHRNFMEVVESEASDQNWEDIEVYCFDPDRPNYIGVPRAFAAKTLGHLKYLQTFARGHFPHPELIPQTIEPRNPLQAEFMNRLIAVNDQVGPVDAFVLANTGVGKTVGALNLVAHDGVPTLIVVHTNRIKEQWLGSARHRQGMRFFWGDNWVSRYAGIAQQDRCDYEGRLVVVGSVHSLARRDYGDDFYNYFGRVIFDEIHKYTTPGLMNVLEMFPARVRIGMTATRRKDNFQKAITFYFGTAAVRSTLRTATPTVYIHEYHAVLALNTWSEPQMLNSLARIGERNFRFAQLIARKYHAGLHIVGLSDRINQLLSIRTMLVDLGVPLEQVGLFVGQYETDRLRLTFEHSDNKSRRAHHPSQTFANQREGTLYMQEWQRTHFVSYLHRETVRYKKYKHHPTEAEYEHMKSHCAVLLATYGLFDTGTDIARITVGVELTPRGDVRQAIGRIGRDPDNSTPPEWHSIVDKIIPPPRLGGAFSSPAEPYAYFIDKARARLQSYQHHKARIVNVGAK